MMDDQAQALAVAASGAPVPRKKAGCVRVAGIDCGTNSIRLMIADVSAGGMEVLVPKVMRVARLGEGVDRTRRFSDAALERTYGYCREFARTIERYDVDDVRFVATSATRDAANKQEFEDGVESILGTRPEVIPGDQEAQLSFLGATSAMGEAEVETVGPVLVVDLGGGSTELVLGGSGRQSRQVSADISLNIGCVRMAERHLPSNPPTDAEIASAIDDVDEHLQRALATVPVGQARTFIGVSGTVTTLSLLALGQKEYSREKVDGAVVDFAAAQRACDAVLRMSHEQMADYPVIHPGRRDVIAGGAVVLSRLLKLVGKQTAAAGHELTRFTASESGLLDGLVLDRGRRLLGL